MRFSVFCVLAARAIAVCLRNPSAALHAPPEQLNVTLYSESLCPDCEHFEMGVWSEAWNTKGIGYGEVVGDGAGIMNFHMVSFGNARISADNKTITCQHGATECLYNTLEACAIAHYPASFLPYIVCLSTAARSGGLSRAKAQACAAPDSGFNWAELDACWTGDEGYSLDRISAAATNALKPAHLYVPWVTLSDAPGTGTFCDEVNDCDKLIEAVCAAYTGQKPAACP